MSESSRVVRNVSATGKWETVRKFLCSSMLTASLFLCSGANAQVGTITSTSDDPNGEDVEEVIVTGSRIVRSDGYEAPTPTTVLGADDILARNPANVADQINQMPQIGRPTSPRTTRGTSNTIQANANLLNMRGLGTARTLVLLDGRRVVSAGLNSAVELNLLPTNLTKRVDIVTGGASAAYGSDAVAGVTNIILDKEFRGVRASTAYGLTEYGDGDTVTSDIAAGGSFADGRGHFLFSGQMLRQDSIDTATDRDWYTPGYAFIANPAYVPGGTEPARITRNDVSFSTATDGGLIVSGPLRGTAFGENGEIYQFEFGDIQAGNLQAGGTFEDPNKRSTLMSDLEHWNTFARVSYELTDDLRLELEGAFGDSDSENWSARMSRFGNIVVTDDNPYLPEEILSAMAANDITSFNMGRINDDVHPPGGHPTTIGYHRQQQRWLVAVEGDFLETGLWQAYYQRGNSDVRYNYLMMTIPSFYSNAIDVVRNPAVGGVPGVAAGDPVCRSTLTDPTNGCVPANIFGTGLLSQESIDYITGVSHGYSPAQQDIDILQEVYSLDVQVEPFSTWAGPVSTAAGVERRRESYTSVVDEASSLRLWFGGGFTPSSGKFTVTEFFGETIIPLLRDAPLAKGLDINAAARRTDYSTSGEVTTWKVGATWDLTDELRLRGTRSRDIRAPNMLELFNGGVTTVGQTRDPTQPGSPIVNTFRITGGNPRLTPEIAKTSTFGVVYRPEWLEGFSASVDYYKISVTDAITTISGQDVVDQCYGVGVPQNPAACDAIVPANPNNLIDATIFIGGLNAEQQDVEGIDYVLSYRLPGGDRLPGSLDLRFIGTQRLKNETFLAGALTDFLGTTADSPEWRALLMASYLQGPSQTTISVQHFGEGVINNWPPGHPESVDNNHYASVTYVELAQNYDVRLFGADVTIFGVIENLLDTDPPPIPGGIGADALHELLGRSYRLGIRAYFSGD